MKLLLAEKPVEQVHQVARQTRRLVEDELKLPTSAALQAMVKTPQQYVAL